MLRDYKHYREAILTENIGNEVSPKVFFSQGFNALTMLNRGANIIKHDVKANSKKGLSEIGLGGKLAQLSIEELQMIALNSRIYYIVDLKGTTREEYEKIPQEEKEKMDYLSDDYNEEYFKKDESGNKTIPDPKHLVNPANMHTITGKHIGIEKIKKIVNDDGKTATVFEVAMVLCDKYKEFYQGKELPAYVNGDGSKDENFLEDIYLKYKELSNKTISMKDMAKNALISGVRSTTVIEADDQNRKEEQTKENEGVQIDD